MWLLTDFPPQDRLEIKPTIDVRERFERRLNRDFSDQKNDDRTDWFTRVRVGATATKGKEWAFALQYQYSHDWIDRQAGKSTDEASDLSLAYVQHKSNAATVTVGRQKVSLGTERLIGAGEWLNVPRSMDGFRIQNKEWDAFAFKIGVGQPKPQDARVFGLSRNWKWGQSSVIYKHDVVNARTVDLGTVSHWMNRKFGAWMVDAEAAIQFGKNRGRDQRAWAWHSAAWHPLGPKTKGFVEFNAASGGSNADTVFTFDNLYPTNHKFYGSMDMQGWKNVNEIAAGVVHQPNPQLDLTAHWHSFTLRDASDAWYGAGGSANKGVNGDFVDPTGARGRNVGWELDIEGTYRWRKDVTFMGGVGIFQPGSFVRSLNGGTADRQVWVFLQAVVRF